MKRMQERKWTGERCEVQKKVWSTKVQQEGAGTEWEDKKKG